MFEWLRRKHKGVNQILPAVITLSVVGIALVMLTYMTKTFQTSLNTTDSTITNIFNTLFSFYGLVASFLSPIGVVILMTVILALVIGLLYYFRGVHGGTA
jgi:NADH:ubiquinone oxidoreductase subunit 6 (subunit J)